jgi:hypothetical protein
MGRERMKKVEKIKEREDEGRETKVGGCGGREPVSHQ